MLEHSLLGIEIVLMYASCASKDHNGPTTAFRICQFKVLAEILVPVRHWDMNPGSIDNGFFCEVMATLTTIQLVPVHVEPVHDPIIGFLRVVCQVCGATITYWFYCRIEECILPSTSVLMKSKGSKVQCKINVSSSFLVESHDGEFARWNHLLGYFGCFSKCYSTRAFYNGVHGRRDLAWYTDRSIVTG